MIEQFDFDEKLSEKVVEKLVRLTAESVEWYTPRLILDPVDAFFDGQIPLDPATPKHNPTKAKIFYTEEDNGLNQPWKIQTHLGVFVNPPYGKVFPDWCRKIKEEAHLNKVPIIALLPCGARFSTLYFQGSILLRELNSICFLNKRVKFLRPDGKPGKSNTYDIMLLGYNINSTRFKKAFLHLGACLEVAVSKADEDQARLGDLRTT